MNGNQQAQEILYNKYKKSVKNFLKSKYSIYYDLDDDVSEIMIKVFLNLKSFDSSKSKFRSWVFSIAKNYMIDKWRSCSSYATTLNNATYTSGTSTDFNCGDVISTSSNSGFITTTNANCLAFTSNSSCTTSNTAFENCNAINYISSQLSPADFTLLDMKYVQGYNYNEIGSEFQLTSSTISNKINYIKTKLKKSITEDIYD